MALPIKVLSFDLDDTLWPCYPTIIRAEELLYQWLSENVSVVTDNYDIDQLREKRLQLLSSKSELAHDLTQLRMHSFEELAKEFGLSEEWIKPAFDVFYQARQEITLFEDVRPVLDELYERFQLVSLTNGNADTIKTGVAHWFDHSLNSSAVGKLKSEPDIYWQVQQLTHIEPQQMVHIGDDPVNDVAGAQKAGAFAIWLNREDRPWPLDSCQPNAIIQHLHALPAALKRL